MRMILEYIELFLISIKINTFVMKNHEKTIKSYYSFTLQDHISFGGLD